MPDVYLFTNEGHAPGDVLLRPSAALTPPVATGGVVTLPRLRPERPKAPPPGAGHLRITLELTGEGRFRSAGTIRAAITGTGQLVPAEITAARIRREAEDLALLLDLPELLP